MYQVKLLTWKTSTSTIDETLIEYGSGVMYFPASYFLTQSGAAATSGIRFSGNDIYFFNQGSNAIARIVSSSSGPNGDAIFYRSMNVGSNSAPSYTLDISSTGGMRIPVGTEAQRPTGASGVLRYNTTDNRYEGYHLAAWKSLVTTSLAAGGFTDSYVPYSDVNGDLTQSSSFTYTGNLTIPGVYVSNRTDGAGIQMNNAGIAFITGDNVTDPPFTAYDVKMRFYGASAINKSFFLTELATTAGATTRNSPKFALQTRRWNGTSDQEGGFYMQAIQRSSTYKDTYLTFRTLDSNHIRTVDLFTIQENGFIGINTSCIVTGKQIGRAHV